MKEETLRGVDQVASQEILFPNSASSAFKDPQNMRFRRQQPFAFIKVQQISLTCLFKSLILM